MVIHNYARIAYYFGSSLHHTRWSRRQLEDFQNNKVRQIMSYAYEHVSFYHRKFDELGIKPADIRTVADLNKIPVTGRDELQKHSEELVSDDFDANKLITVSTSGSTGRPFFTRITDAEDDFRKVKLLRANIICGQKPRDKWVVVTAPQHMAHVPTLQRFFGVYCPVPVSVFDGSKAQLAKMEKLMPDVLDGYSSSLLLLAREADKKGRIEFAPRMIIGGAELIDASSRKYVEGVFNAPFYDEYACVELERLAWQCKEKKGYHIDADSVVMEFLDEDGKKVGPGETGEIVCTSLFNYAMPFIRYAVGDVGKVSKESECSCGISFPLMEVIEGRKDSLIVLPDGRVLSPLVFGWIMEFFKYYSHINQYRVVQKRIDLFRFIIKKKDSEVDEKHMEVELPQHFRRFLNLDVSEVDFEVVFVDEIPLDKSGKLRKVISEIRALAPGAC